jgi:predicted nucleic acid-binding Zn ribbon protein
MEMSKEIEEDTRKCKEKCRMKEKEDGYDEMVMRM